MNDVYHRFLSYSDSLQQEINKYAINIQLTNNDSQRTCATLVGRPICYVNYKFNQFTFPHAIVGLYRHQSN